MDSRIFSRLKPRFCAACWEEEKYTLLTPGQTKFCKDHAPHVLPNNEVAAERAQQNKQNVKNFRDAHPKRAAHQNDRAHLRRQIRAGEFLPFLMEEKRAGTTVGWWLWGARKWRSVRLSKRRLEDLRDIAWPVEVPEGLSIVFGDLLRLYRARGNFVNVSGIEMPRDPTGTSEFHPGHEAKPIPSPNSTVLVPRALWPWVKHWLAVAYENAVAHENAVAYEIGVRTDPLPDAICAPPVPSAEAAPPNWPPRSEKGLDTPAALLMEAWSLLLWIGPFGPSTFQIPKFAFDLNAKPLVRNGSVTVVK